MTLLLMLLLKSFFVFALSGLALVGLRRASASARHLVCLLTLSALLALPLFSLTLPGWHVAALLTTDQLPQPMLMAAETAPPAPNTGGARTAHAEPAPVLPEPPAAHSAPAFSPAPPVLRAGGLLTFYLLGLLLASMRPLLGLWGIARLRRACVPVTDAPTLRVSEDCAAALGLTRLPLLCRTDVLVPLTWGGRRPVVALPLASADWPEDRLRSVLLHEMAHVKRRDWPCHRLADLACAVYWFHPLVWLLARRLRSESEAACDDLVLSSGIAAPDYARHLLEIAGALSRPLPAQSAIAMAQTPHIKRRILMVLDKTHSRRTVTRRALLLALIPSAAALLTLAALRPSVRAQTTPAPVSTTSPAAVPPTQTLLSVEDLKLNGKSLLAGVTDANKPGGTWWSATGALLPAPVYDTNAYRAENHASPNAHTVSIAFRLPANAIGTTVRYELPQSLQSSDEGSWVGKMRDDAGLTESQKFTQTAGTRVVTAEYPANVSKVSIRVGVASGHWTLLTKIVPGQVDTSALTTPAGSFIVGPLEQATTGSILSVAASQITQDIRIVGVDIAGRDEFPTTMGDQSIGTLDQISAHFNFPLVPLKEVRVETRPFQWIEFKDVALKPVQ